MPTLSVGSLGAILALIVIVLAVVGLALIVLGQGANVPIWALLTLLLLLGIARIT